MLNIRLNLHPSFYNLVEIYNNLEEHSQTTREGPLDYFYVEDASSPDMQLHKILEEQPVPMSVEGNSPPSRPSSFFSAASLQQQQQPQQLQPQLLSYQQLLQQQLQQQQPQQLPQQLQQQQQQQPQQLQPQLLSYQQLLQQQPQQSPQQLQQQQPQQLPQQLQQQQQPQQLQPQLLSYQQLLQQQTRHLPLQLRPLQPQQQQNHQQQEQIPDRLIVSLRQPTQYSAQPQSCIASLPSVSPTKAHHASEMTTSFSPLVHNSSLNDLSSFPSPSLSAQYTPGVNPMDTSSSGNGLNFPQTLQQATHQPVPSSLGSSCVLQNESVRNTTSTSTPSSFFSASCQADMSRSSPLNTLADATVQQGPMNEELVENEGLEEDASSSDMELIPRTLSRSVNKLDTWRKMSENEGPVSGSVVNEPAKLSEAKASEQDDSLLQSRSANLKCTNAECRKREDEINRLKKELNEVKRKLQESEKKGHKKTDIIRLVLNEKKGLEKKIKNFETEQVLEHDVPDGAKRLQRLKLKEEDERENSTHPLASNFVSPFNCNSSCVLSVVFFIFYKMNINICNRWFLVKMRIDLGEIPDDSIEVGECSIEVGECIYVLRDLFHLTLIEGRFIFLKKNIKMDEIGNALKDVKTKMQTEKYPALLVVKYGMPSMPQHCVAIMPTTDDSEDVEIYDVQKNEQWNMNSNKVKSITEIQLYKIDEKVAKAWEREYSSSAECKVNVRRNSDFLDGASTNAV